MKKKNYFSVLIFEIIFYFYGCGNYQNTSPIDAKININQLNLKDSNFIKKNYFIIIPKLIDAISIEKTIDFVGYIDSLSSFHLPCQCNNFIGIEYAFNIEYILGGNFVDSLKKGREIYYLGVINKLDKSQIPINNVMEYTQIPINNVMEYVDMLEIQFLYKKWWLKNRYKPLDLLQQEWKIGIRPLNNSNYVWL